MNIAYTEVTDTLCDSLVEDGCFDVGITVEPASEKLNSVEVVSSPLMILINKADPLSEKRSLELKDLSNRKLAMPGKEFHIYNNLIEAYEKEGIPQPNIVEYAEIFWIYNFVEANKGFGFSLPHLLSLDMFSSSDDIVALPLDDMRWRVAFTWPRSRNLLPYMKDYLSVIKQAAKRMRK